jgi:DNA-binding MarR family transcriptional regulator
MIFILKSLDVNILWRQLFTAGFACKFTHAPAVVADWTNMTTREKKKFLAKKLLDPEIVSWRALLDTKKAILAVLESCFQIEGFTVGRFHIMFNLYFEGPMSPTALSRINRFTKGNTSTFLKRMISDGLVETSPGESKGRPRYGLTTFGVKQFEDLLPRHLARIKQIMIPLEEGYLENLRIIRERVAGQGSAIILAAKDHTRQKRTK